MGNFNQDRTLYCFIYCDGYCVNIRLNNYKTTCYDIHISYPLFITFLLLLIPSSDLRPALLDHVNYKTAVAVLYNRWDEMKDVRTVIALLNQERWPDVSERLRKRLGTGDPQEIKRIWKNQMTLVSYCLRTDQVQELLKS